MLKVEHVFKTFNPGTITEKKALKDLSLHLAPGDFVTVIGGNGAGTSTMMNSICGTFLVDQGEIHRSCISGSHDGNGSRYAD